MSTVMSQRGTAVQNGWALLMARIVDRDGANIRQDDVIAIEITLCELDPCWPHNLIVVAGHSGLTLDVGQVLFDELQVDDVWRVDAMGYNFRHELDFGHSTQFPKVLVGYEARYRIALASGQRSVVRFYLRC